MANNIRGITIEIDGKTDKLQDALQGVSKNLKSTKNELKEVEKGLKLDPKNTELLAQKQQLLTKAVGETKDKLDVLKTAEAQVEQQFKNGEASEEQYRAIKREVIATEAEGEYKIFKVFEPKERLIMALPFYDRVVQHMICNAIQPVFENGFYYHSYACRSGKGMHAASDTLYQWMYETEVKQGLRMYAFKGDISKYFASIPHDKLKDENRRYIGDKKALMLMDDIIDHNGILPDGVGIPVGNLTSQLFANVYGNKLDKFCKHVLHIPYFVRYMDDFIILSDDLEQLKEWVKRIEEFLENEMLLHINPKSTILYAGNGIDFCGYIHYADHKKVRKSSIRKLKQDVKAYELGELPPEEFNRKYESRKGHLGHADTYHIAKAVEYELLFYEWERLEATA